MRNGGRIRMNKLYLGIKIGASKHQIALGDEFGNLLDTDQGRVNLCGGLVRLKKCILIWRSEYLTGKKKSMRLHKRSFRLVKRNTAYRKQSEMRVRYIRSMRY